MKKQYVLKTIVVILLVFLAFSLTGCLFGTVQPDYLYSTGSLSENHQSLTMESPEGTTSNYALVGTVDSAELYGEKYLYEAIAVLENGYVADIYSPLADKDIIYLDCYGTVYCYVRAGCESEREDLLAFLGGEGSIFSIADQSDNREGALSRTERDALCATPSAENIVTVDVSELKNLNSYEILSYDMYHVLNVTSGKIFRYGDSYILVDYARLDNSAFDADGNLSFRKGEIEAERLTGEKLTLFKTVLNRWGRIKNETHYEQGLYVGDINNDREDEIARFTVGAFVFFFGVLVPAVPAIFVLVYTLTAKKRALVLGESEKARISAPMIVVGVGALIWLLAGIALLLFVLLL